MEEMGFTLDTPVEVRMLSDCIIITTQNSRKLWGCAEGLSATHFNKKKINQWIKAFPETLNDTGDLPVIRQESPHNDCLKRGKG